MFSRLDFMTLNPQTILDLGCGTGEMAQQLHERYPQAQLLALDLSPAMIEYAKKNATAALCVCADAQQLPLRAQSVDLIFANFLLPWHDNTTLLLRECKRILKAEGVFMFTALGPDTLLEWSGIFAEETLPRRVDMHDFGDALLKEGFQDPVLDVNHYTVNYRDSDKLMMELCATGMLTESMSLDLLTSSEEDTWSVTYEIIYAHAFAPQKSAQTTFNADQGMVKVPLSHLRKTLINES